MEMLDFQQAESPSCVDDSLEIYECLVWIDAHAIRGQTIVHHLKKLFSVETISSYEQEIVDEPKRRLSSG